MRNNILGLAAAIALCTTTINTGGTAAYGRGSHSVVIFAATSATGPGATRPDRRAASMYLGCLAGLNLLRHTALTGRPSLSRRADAAPLR